MYCSKACQLEDWKIHQKVCKEDLEERKKKSGGKDRKEEAKDALEKLEEKFTDMSILEKKDENCCELCLRNKRSAPSQEEACCSSEVINKFKIRNDKNAEN